MSISQNYLALEQNSLLRSHLVLKIIFYDVPAPLLLHVQYSHHAFSLGGFFPVKSDADL